eukprot:Nitzschia sp. Nitz4//scaffold100_size80364//9341//9924//NITZ4_005333-RA/size80364-augustus-gene-0.6-mRNA-1//1//CDS//3329532061//9200//frame0
MVADMSYSTVSQVIETWEAIRRKENYEEAVGTKLFQRFFALEPEAKQIFGFSKDMDMTREEVLKNQRFVRHAKYFVQMLDKALSMLGPDIEMLTEVLLELGEKHVRYGVKPEFYPSMGRALMDTIQEILGTGHFTPDVKADWVEVYGALSYDMIRAQSHSKA